MIGVDRKIIQLPSSPRLLASMAST